MNSINHSIFLNSNKLAFYRRLLKTSAQCLSGKEFRNYNAAASSNTDKCNTETKPPKIVIIGAGIAGLSAAVRLLNAGLSDLIILEATERPGGRIYSCWLGNTVAEIGAQWITGSSLSNSIIPLASQAGLLDTLYEYDYSAGTYMACDGRPLDPLISSHAYLTFKQLVKQAYALFSVGSSQNHGSLMNFFTVRIEQELNNFPVNQRKDAASIMYGLTNKLSNRWGVELQCLSADLFGAFNPLIGKTIGLPIGFVSLLSPLIKEIPQDMIRYSKIVDEVQWQGVPESRVLVKTSDLCTFSADYVVVTVSLGVLKNLGTTMFSPCLPVAKRSAIDKIGFGNISKIFFEYKRPFWIPKQGPIKFAWTPEDLSKRDTWLKGLHSLEEVPGSNQILMGTVAGKYADSVEKLKDIEIAENITALLRHFTHDPTIPYPDSVLRSKWKSSPFFFGATSYMGLNSSVARQVELMTPVPTPNIEAREDSPRVIPKLFFAGEAMSKEFFSTVHGARLSGLSAAEDIVNLTNELDGPPPLYDLCQEEDEEDEKGEGLEDECSKEQSSKDECSKEQSSKDECSKEQSSKDKCSKEQSSKDECSKEKSLKDECSK